MGEGDETTLNENDKSKKHGHSANNGLFQFLLFYFYLIFGNILVLLEAKFLFCRYYSI